ncbi:hypothetical protein CEV08_08110 [Bartonella tribocorum]|uniref:Uncharacterized protein n=1 Tax=Bartonella tribocorum TaxID=85701 RepID=A0A2M6UQH1_9HYPH|nr:hypothetical protein CEV08_08110 [Bartonella tribocorum]
MENRKGVPHYCENKGDRQQKSPLKRQIRERKQEKMKFDENRKSKGKLPPFIGDNRYLAKLVHGDLIA